MKNLSHRDQRQVQGRTRRRPRCLALGVSLFAVLAALRAGGSLEADCASFDFAGQLAHATIEPETRFLDLGTREARPQLLSGWSIDELWHGKESFVWAMGDAAALRFTRFAAEPFTLYFRCRPIDLADAAPQEVAIVVNGTQVGAARLKPAAAGFESYQMAIPAAVLRLGENRLELRFAHFRESPPVPRGFPGLRRLAVAWDWIGFGAKAAPATPPPQPSAPAGSFSLPFLTRVELNLAVPPGSSLHWRAVRAWRTSRLGPGAALEVNIGWDGPGGRTISLPQRAFSSPADIALNNQKTASARISFLARPGKSANAETSGLTIELPQLLAAGCLQQVDSRRQAGSRGSRPQPSHPGW